MLSYFQILSRHSYPMENHQCVLVRSRWLQAPVTRTWNNGLQHPGSAPAAFNGTSLGGLRQLRMWINVGCLIITTIININQQ